MELWEKEYLELIKDEQNKKENEKKQEQKKQYSFSTLLISFVCFIFLYVFSSIMFNPSYSDLINVVNKSIVSQDLQPSYIQEFATEEIAESIPIEISSIPFESQNQKDTYLDGKGFHSMITCLNGCGIRANNIFTEIILNINTVQQNQIIDWNKQIKNEETTLALLTYHESYIPLIQAHQNVLQYEKNLLNLLNQPRTQSNVIEIKATCELIYNGLESLTDMAIQIMTNNGIQCKKNPDNTFQYSYNASY